MVTVIHPKVWEWARLCLMWPAAPANGNGYIRFVIKNNGTWYISDYVICNNGSYTVTGLNNSSEPGKRWMVYHFTNNNFDAVSPFASVSNAEAVIMNNVTEVGFVFTNRIFEWANSFNFTQFQVYASVPQELEVTINPAPGQANPATMAPINYTVVFEQPVTGFTGADIKLSGSASPSTCYGYPDCSR